MRSLIASRLLVSLAASALTLTGVAAAGPARLPAAPGEAPAAFAPKAEEPKKDVVPAVPSAVAPALPPVLHAPAGCGCAAPAAPAPEPAFRAWAEADFLVWYLRSMSLPPLLTTGSPAGGVPGGLDTRILFGGNTVNGDEPYLGGQLRLGALSEDAGLGAEASGFYLGRRGTTFAADSGQFPLLTRPFVNADGGNVESVATLGVPNGFDGSFVATTSTEAFGGEANLIARTGFGPIEFVYGGFRYIGLRDEVSLADRTTLRPGGLAFFDGLPIAEGDTRVRNDLFRTRNDFYGANVGVKATGSLGSFDASVRTSVALGTTVERVSISGTSVLLPAAGGAAVLPGGLLAVGSNSRSESTAKFAFAPEVNLSLGYRLAERARVSFGYNFLYVSSVARAGDQIDRNVNITQVPTSPTFDPTIAAGNPRFAVRPTDFWMQGVNLGLSLSF